MNVIILDACRDNPFRSLEGLDQKGLSQMDAPRSTLLAYATSPGNVASDGAGGNSLYAEHLTREMQVHYTPNQLEPMEYAVGKRWRTEFGVSTPRGMEGRTAMDLRITARERVTVPAGTFEAFRIEGHGVLADGDRRVLEETQLLKWTAPDRLRMPVAVEETPTRKGRRPHTAQSLRLELARFREA